jgi:3-deoxy-D-manno-octulosonic-acid transferase
LDGERFGQVVGPEKVSLMNNIKFDRIEPKNDFSTNTPIAGLLPESAPFILLGSVRREEEEKILTAITATLPFPQTYRAGRPLAHPAARGRYPRRQTFAGNWPK